MNTTIKSKRVADLVPGDKVIVRDTGATVTIKRVSLGWSPGTLMVQWDGGWCCERKTVTVEIAP